MNDPRRLERIAPPVAVAAAPADTGKPAVAEPVFKSSVAGDPAGSYYKSPTGIRISDALPRTGEPSEAISVAAILDTGAVRLPDSTGFLRYPYKLKLAPDYIATPTIGYTHDNFGSGLYGGTAITLSDMVGETVVTGAFAVNGRLEDFQLYGAYAYLAGRFQYQVGFQNQPFYYSNGSACTVDYSLCQQAVTRYLNRSIFGTGIYPLNRFDRFEVGLGLNALNRQAQIITTDYVNQTQKRDIVSLGTTYYAMPDVAYVSDNTLFGYFAPISGRRYRFEIQPAVGGYRWMGYMADYRRYDPIIFNKLIFAYHVQGVYRTGRDADSVRQYLAYSQAVRGYDGSNFIINTSGCAVGYPDPCNPAIGSSAIRGNFEIRAPFYRGGGGVMPVPPVELFAFYDAGVTWFSGQTVKFARQANYDPMTTRALLTSFGFGARVNLFGAAILSWAWVMPQDIGQRPYFIFSLYPPF